MRTSPRSSPHFFRHDPRLGSRPRKPCATSSVERYGPGEEASQFEPGDFILTHRHRAIAALISFGQKRRFRGADSVYAHWSHSAIVVDVDGGLVEAESMGVVKASISKYRATEYHVVRLGSELDAPGRKRTVDYANAQVGVAFGYLALAGVTIYLLTGLPVRLMRRNHQICSELVVRALQAGGLLINADPSLTLPADLAKRFNIRP